MKFIQIIPTEGDIIGLTEDGEIYYGRQMIVNGEDEIHWKLVPSRFNNKETNTQR